MISLVHTSNIDALLTATAFHPLFSDGLKYHFFVFHIYKTATAARNATPATAMPVIESADWSVREIGEARCRI